LDLDNFYSCIFVPKNWDTLGLSTLEMGVYFENPNNVSLPQCLSLLALACSQHVFLLCLTIDHEFKVKVMTFFLFPFGPLMCLELALKDLQLIVEVI
jgi:hypothetical protein